MENEVISPALAASRLHWDVFLSFRGEDTCYTITMNLYKALEKEGIRVFRDDDGLNRGDEIAPSLLEAIEDSAASIVILSPNYATSRWCLEELAKICELRRLILPVFYQVDPSDVRRQKGPFEEAFRSHERRFAEKEVSKWRKAMAKVGGIAGYSFREEELLIRSLIKRVLNELSNTPVSVAPYIVGHGSRLENLMELIDIRSDVILFLGLHGMGGVGKTTLAKALYNKLVAYFSYRCFISNVRETSRQHDGLISLQNKLIGNLFGSNLPIDDVGAGISAFKQMVHEKKVLIVLDDVDDVSQLNALAGKREWFGEGSRIVITTRDRGLLLNYNVSLNYEVRELEESQALELFSFYALRREKPTESFFNLSKQIVSLTGGLPLALEVFGSFLLDKRRVEDWEDALQKLKQIRPRDLQDVLKISFDGLDDQEKCIFLDIACLFVKMGMKREDVTDIVNGCRFGNKTAIRNLTEKSLIKFTVDDTLWMHDQLRDMGRQIVQHENLVNPGMRSRLWDRGEIIHTLSNNRGTESNQGIVLDFRKKPPKDPSAKSLAWQNFQKRPNLTSAVKYLKVRFTECLKHDVEEETEAMLQTKPFKSMVNLRLLQINHVKVKGNFKFLPAQLKWLQWKGCPLESLPSQFCPRNLAVLDISESPIARVWGSHCKKVAENLMVMNLCGCYNLVAIPDLSGCKKLEKLLLEGCIRLVTIHKSIGTVGTLLHLNLTNCSSLTEFSSDVSGLKSLESLVLSGCSKLKELPDDISSMRSLKELLVDETAITKLPESIFHLAKLEKLSLNGCRFIKQLPECLGKLDSLRELHLNQSALEELPDSVGSLTNLEKLSLIRCRSLNAMPHTIGNLKSLTEFFAHGSAIRELPPSIVSLPYLKHLMVGECEFLSKLPDSIGELASLVELQLDGTPIIDLPTEIGALKLVQKLEMRNCRSLRSLPESLGNMEALTTLNLHGSSITELPESIGMLENLVIIRMNKCKQLHKLPASIGMLKSLHHLHMAETAVTELPESFGMLTRLMVLKMSKKPLFRMPEKGGPPDAAALCTHEKLRFVQLPESFSSLSSLEVMEAWNWRIAGNIPDDFEKLSSLQILKLGNNYICRLPSSLRGLSVLKNLSLYDCQELKSLPPLPSSLQDLILANCISLENISDLSNLGNLQELNLTNCEKVVDVPGLECLKSLKRLYMSGCNRCSSAVKRRLSKVYLKKLRNLSMPGSKIPDWFSGETVSFSKPKIREIKAIIIGIVVSLNQEMPDDLRYQIPAVVDILAKVLKLGQPIVTTTLHLHGVPRTNEDQVHLCRFPGTHPLVSQLKDGYQIQVTKRDPPYTKGVELKKGGIYLVFEDDDDYDGDEESLNESQQSISQKLVKFFRSFAEDDHISQPSGSSGVPG